MPVIFLYLLNLLQLTLILGCHRIVSQPILQRPSDLTKQTLSCLLCFILTLFSYLLSATLVLLWVTLSFHAHISNLFQAGFHYLRRLHCNATFCFYFIHVPGLYLL